MSAEFVANMEDVLDLYAEPYDPQRPVVCFDETSTQLLAETRPPLPPRPGLPLRQDYEYRREGVRNLFLACEPLAGWREVAVTERRTMQDFARRMRWLVDEAYPEAEAVRVVLDNLNTHRRASLYETFPAEEARRIARRLEFHGGLRLNRRSRCVLSRSCLKKRLSGRRGPQKGSRCPRSATPPEPPSGGSPPLPFRSRLTEYILTTVVLGFVERSQLSYPAWWEVLTGVAVMVRDRGWTGTGTTGRVHRLIRVGKNSGR